jgi:hypothetical protein
MNDHDSELFRIMGEYLTGSMNTWSAVAVDQVQSFIAWLSRRSFISEKTIRESRLSHDLHQTLLEPESVRRYISLGTVEAVERAVTHRMHSAVSASGIKAHIVTSKAEDEEVYEEEEAAYTAIITTKRGLYAEKVALDDGDSSSAQSYDPFRILQSPEDEWWANFRDAQIEPQIIEADPTIEPVRLSFLEPDLYAAILGNPELMRSLDWRSFEKLLAQIIEDFGYEVDLQRGTKDGGVDIFAIRRTGGAFGVEKYLVQAKRWKNSVGVQPVRELLYLHTENKMTKSCLATTATFTAGAWDLADVHKWTLSLKDFAGLSEWVQDANVIRKSGDFKKTHSGIYIPK